jgi:hypothetical protein
MRIPASFPLCGILLFFLILPAVGQPGVGENIGTLQGIVKLADGTPLPAAAVSVQVGDERYTFTTRPNGTFSGVVRPGKAVASCYGQTVELTVTVGAVVPVEITIPLAGALVTAAAPDGTPADVPLRAAFRALDDAREVSGIRLAAGRWLFPEVPADTTELSVIADRKYPQSDCRREWAFTDVQALRAVSITVAGDAPLVVTIVDEGGKPIANAPVRGTVRLTAWDAPFWEEDGLKQRGQTSDQRVNARTDAAGQVTLGRFSPGCDYELMLEAGGKSGPEVKGEIAAEGPTATRYTAAWAVRRVAQTVFGADGKHVANAEVFATYSWHNQGKLLRAVSDANGKVVWEGLPPTRVTVWGPKVPAGFIPRDAMAVNAPMPEAVPTGVRFVDLILDMAVKEPVVTRWLLSPGPNYEPCVFRMNRFDPTGKVPTPRTGGTFTSGRKTSVLAIVETDPPQIAYFRDRYLPAPERDERYSLPVPLMPCAVLHGRFVTPDGWPVPGVSRLGIKLLQCDNPPPDFAFDENSKMPLFATLLPRERPGGRFDLILPAPGTYQLLVDAFDESVPAPPALILRVEPGERDITITLPAPLVTVPAGAAVRWRTKQDAETVRTLTAAAHAPEMPFFAPLDEITSLTFPLDAAADAVWENGQLTSREKAGGAAVPLFPPLLPVPSGTEVHWLRRTAPLEIRSAIVRPGEVLPFTREELLALWYHPMPGEMVLWNGQTGAASRLPLRSVWLMPGDNEFYDVEGFRLTPLLPGAGGLTLHGGTPLRCDLWAGEYAILRGNPSRFCAAVTIPPVGPAEIPLELDGRNYVPLRIDYTSRKGKLVFPPGNYAAWGKLGNQPIAFFDTGFQFSLNWRPGQPTGEVYNIPLAARSFSLQWVGVGVMRNLALVREQTLPAWAPGCTVAGVLLNEQGKPAPNAPLVVNASPTGELNFWPPGSLKVTTDAQGRFTVKGLLPGWFYARLDKSGSAWWAFPLPDAPLTKITLAPAGRAVRYTSGYPANFGMCYWIPRNGAPIPLPKDGSGFSCQNLPAGPGMLWGAGGVHSRLAAYDNPPAEVVLGKLPATGPTLGIALPFDPARGFPDRVRLTGAGARRGLQAGGSRGWQYLPQLGLTVTQLDAVPPGDYTLTVETTAGVAEGKVTVTDEGGYIYLDLPR